VAVAVELTREMLETEVVVVAGVSAARRVPEVQGMGVVSIRASLLAAAVVWEAWVEMRHHRGVETVVLELLA
jgi:hypothetical protein